jgi:hypothetical protein
MPNAAIFIMSLALALVSLTCGALAAIIYCLRRAPEGYEDETGFHVVPGSQLPAGSDLHPDSAAEQFAAQSKILRPRGAQDSIGIAVTRVREAH